MVNQENILIIRLSSLGDVLLTTPVVRAVQSMFPEAAVSFLVRPGYADVYRYHHGLKAVLLYPPGKAEQRELRRDILRGGYTRVLDLQNNLRTALLLRGIGAPVYRFKKHSLAKFLLVHLKRDLLARQGSIPERYAASFPGLVLDEHGLSVAFPPEYPQPAPAADKTVVLCPGSRHNTKQWLPEYFAQLARMLLQRGYTPVVVGGKEEAGLVRGLAGSVPGAVAVPTGDSLFLTLAVMRQARLVVCNDSGLMHCAAAAGVPLLAVFGSTTRSFGFSPYKARHLVLEDNSLTCRPCSHIGKSSCPLGHFNCMKGLTPPMALRMALTLLGEQE